MQTHGRHSDAGCSVHATTSSIVSALADYLKLDLGPESPLPASLAGSRACDPLEGEYESFPTGGGNAVESFAFTKRGDQCITWGSRSGASTYTLRDGVLSTTMHHCPPASYCNGRL